jgi:hypothetical protein
MPGGTSKIRQKTFGIIRVLVDSAPGSLHCVNVCSVDSVSGIHPGAIFRVEMSRVDQANSDSVQGNVIKTTHFRAIECAPRKSARWNGLAATPNH